MNPESPRHLRAADLDDGDLLALYPWPAADSSATGFSGQRPWVRAMMVTTLDGAAAGTDGLSGSISSAADKRVFNTVRRLADVVLIGAHTMRTEQYSAMRSRESDVEMRAAAGQAPAPVVAVVSASLNLPWHLPLWQESTGRPLILTGKDANPEALEVAKGCAEVCVLDPLEPAAMVNCLVERGLGRIVCEGGPRLLRDLSAAGLVDEVDITIAPLLSGTESSPSTAMIANPHHLRLVHTVFDENYLMTRYLVEAE